MYLDGKDIKDRDDFYIKITKLLGWGVYFSLNSDNLCVMMKTQIYT